MGARLACGVLVLATAGCESLLGLDRPGEAIVTSDGLLPVDMQIVDTGIDATPPCIVDGFDRGITPDPPRVFTGPTTVMTDVAGNCTDIRTEPIDLSQACLIYAETILVEDTAVVTANGVRPLIIASRSSMVIAGTVNGNSDRDNVNHGGTCAGVAAGEAEVNIQGAGGGGGGGFGTAGASGGTAENGESLGGTGRPAVTLPAVLRGGCLGGLGGESNNQNNGGGAGSSGGAVWLVAGSSLAIGGVVRANGLPGQGGGAVSGGGAGGGGGGSGGYIRIAAGGRIEITGSVSANGAGGGGGGGDTTAGTAGAPAGDGVTGTQGGSGGQAGGDGGMGGATTPPANGYESFFNGAGGGGGGAGFVVLVGTVGNVSGSVSPVPIEL